MTDTVHLGLPVIEAAQAQKHVTHNEALAVLDALVMLAVVDRDLSAPPASPDEGDRYIVKAAGTGAFLAKDNQIAHYLDGSWSFYAPATGWTCYVEDEAALVAWDGTAWQAVAGGGGGGGGPITELQNLVRLGLGTTADATNPFAARLNNALWTATKVVDGGDGNLRYKLSKESADKTLSFLFQDNFSGRAEIGLVGDDDFRFKVSPDGSVWHDALIIARTTGQVSFPNSPSSGGVPTAPQGRLTLAAGTPVMTASVAATGTLRYTPYVGNGIWLYSGGAWVRRSFAETTLALSAGTASRPHDIWAYDNSGTLALDLTAWTNDTTRATALAYQDGWLVKSGDATRLYLGSVYLDGSKQAQWTFGSAAAGGGAAVFSVWNMYHRIDVGTIVKDIDNTWTATAPVIQPFNAGGTGSGLNNRVSFIQGLGEDSSAAEMSALLATVSGSNGGVGVGLNSTTAFSGSVMFSIAGLAAAAYGTPTAPAFGRHAANVVGWNYYQALQSAQGSGTNTYYGDAGLAYIQSGLAFRGRF